MELTREELIEFMNNWNQGWDEYDIDKVVEGFADDIVFDNWTGVKVYGKNDLYAAWSSWFKHNGGFKFKFEDMFVDEAEQKVLYRWALHWPSIEKGHEGKPEIRRGVDVMSFRDGKIYLKLTYCKTTLEIDGEMVRLGA